MLRKRARSPKDSKPAIALFLFRRDLRVEDNISFYHLLSLVTKGKPASKFSGLPILPCFFFLPRQAHRERNPYFSDASFTFLKQSLVDLNASHQLNGHLAVLRATPDTAALPEKFTTKKKRRKEDDLQGEPSLIDGEMQLLGAISEYFQIEALGYSPGDYTPFARRRDLQLNAFCESLGIEVVQPQPTVGSEILLPFQAEYSLLPLDSVRTGQGKIYSVFTPFYNQFLNSGFDKQIPGPMSLATFVQKLSNEQVGGESSSDGDKKCWSWLQSKLLPRSAWPTELFRSYGVTNSVRAKQQVDSDALSIETFTYDNTEASERTTTTTNTDPIVSGGRSAALLRLHVAVPLLRNYEVSRNELPVPLDDGPALRGQGVATTPTIKLLSDKGFLQQVNRSTTLLSPYMKFGCVSVREVFHRAVKEFGRSSVLVKELLWREFFAMQVWQQPSLLQGQLMAPGVFLWGPQSKLYPALANNLAEKEKVVSTADALLEFHNQPFQELYQPFRWQWRPTDAALFFEGRTDIPLVDAAIRCLRTTGFCPNRLRMVIAIVGTKVFGIDWRICEQFYASFAVDYDPSSNSGGWQWASGQGADALPYFRTMNPYLQSKKFDPEGVFIRHFVEELRSEKQIPVKALHDAESPVGKQLRDKAKETKEIFEQFRASSLGK